MSTPVQNLKFREPAARAAAAAEELEDLHGQKMVLNMGPSHPAMHGTIRMVLKLDGETVLGADVQPGYVHRGQEKMGERGTWQQFVKFCNAGEWNELRKVANSVNLGVVDDPKSALASRILTRRASDS